MERSVDLLRMVKITAPNLRVRNYPHEMSGGMRQRASSAASIGPHPDLLIADEPTTALDVTTQRQYLELLKELQQQTGMALIFITHDISIVGNLLRQPSRVLRRAGRGIRPQGPGAEPPDPPVHRGPSWKPCQSSERSGSASAPSRATRPAPATCLRGCPFHPRCDKAIDRLQRRRPAPPSSPRTTCGAPRCWLVE